LTGGPGHTPVLLDLVDDWLALEKGRTAVDLTGGSAGHSKKMARTLSIGGTLVVFDKDPDAVRRCEEALADAPCKVMIVREDFSRLGETLARLGVETVDAVLADLGVSSNQLLDPGRGFGFESSGSLDMRMDPQSDLTASRILQTWPPSEIERILRDYADEPAAKRIAAAIQREREKEPSQEWSASRLRTLVRSVAHNGRKSKTDPATRTFLALRVAVNDELGALERMLPQALDALRIGGRLAVITFHSIEDRIVKRFMQTMSKGCICPKDFPVCKCGIEPRMRVLTKKPAAPSSREIDENPRARSAKLRVGERIA